MTWKEACFPPKLIIIVLKPKIIFQDELCEVSCLPHVTVRERNKKGSCWFNTVDINFLNYPLMVKLWCESSQRQRKPKHRLKKKQILESIWHFHYFADRQIAKKKQQAENKMSHRFLEKVWLRKLIKDKQKGSIRASSKGLTRGYGHELLKLIPDVWGLSAISSRRPTRLKNWQNCKITILLNKTNISLCEFQSCYIFC